MRTNTSVVSEDQNWTTQVGGTTPEYLELRSWPIAQGRTLSASDIESTTKVVLLGRTVVEKLFGAKSVEKAVEIQQDYVKSAYEGFVAQATKMGELYVDLAKQAYKPYEGYLAKLTPGK